MAKYKKLGSVTLFDAQNTKEELSKLGNPLERLSQVVDFEMIYNFFRLEQITRLGIN